MSSRALRAHGGFFPSRVEPASPAELNGLRWASGSVRPIRDEIAARVERLLAVLLPGRSQRPGTPESWDASPSDLIEGFTTSDDATHVLKGVPERWRLFTVKP